MLFKIRFMKKYRIIETGNGFFIQKKFLLFFWDKVYEPRFIHCGHNKWVETSSAEAKYRTLIDAQKALRRIQNTFYKYKGHKITYYLNPHNELRFVDLSSKVYDFLDGEYYKIGGQTLQSVYHLIDNDEELKEIQKNNKKIKNIYYI